jgi:hypothetical protein
MDIGRNRDIEVFPDGLQDTQGPFVADAGKGIFFAAIGLPVRAFEYIRYAEAGANAMDFRRNFVGHVFAFNGTRAGDEEKITGIGMFEAGYG